MKIKEHIQISARAVRMCFHLDKRYTSCMILEAALSAVVGYIPVYFSAKVIDALYSRASVLTVAAYAALTVGLVFGVKLLSVYVSSVKNTEAEAMYRSERWMYSEKAMELAYERIEDPQVTRLRYRIEKETQTGYNRFFLHMVIECFTGEAVKIAASLAMTASFFALASVPVYLKLLMAAGVMTTLAVSVFTTSKTEQLQRNFGETCVDMNIMAEQFMEYIEDYGAGKDIRLYDMKEHLAGEYLRINRDFYRAEVEKSVKQALWTVPVTVLEYVFQFIVYGILIYAALRGGISVGSIARYTACLMMLIDGACSMTKTLRRSFENHYYLKRYFSYFDIPNPMYKGSLTVEKRDDSEYDIEFRNVSFRYPGSSTYALQNVSLRFRIGEKLAIVGPNGSGKTTFIKLLCRLYDPSEGEILLNGVNIQKYDYDEYMSVFSVVFQDFCLFDFKLGEVVAAGKEFDRERVRECLIQANFGDRYETLSEGTDTYLRKGFDQSGVEISGGEAQKIALARALYKNAPFILLDEPTAALDPVSEYEVYVNFNRISGDKTAVYISHRLASCRFCDKIAVFDGGQLVQTGTHKELLADTKGRYRELWNAQAQYYVPNAGAVDFCGR